MVSYPGHTYVSYLTILQQVYNKGKTAVHSRRRHHPAFYFTAVQVLHRSLRTAERSGKDKPAQTQRHLLGPNLKSEIHFYLYLVLLEYIFPSVARYLGTT